MPRPTPLRVPRDVPIVHPTGPRKTTMPARYAGNGDSSSKALRARGDVEGEHQVRRRAPSSVHLNGANVVDGPLGDGAVPPMAAPQPAVAAGGISAGDGGNAAGPAAASRVVDAPAAALGQPQPAVAAPATQLPRPCGPQVRG